MLEADERSGDHRNRVDGDQLHCGRCGEVRARGYMVRHTPRRSALRPASVDGRGRGRAEGKQGGIRSGPKGPTPHFSDNKGLMSTFLAYIGPGAGFAFLGSFFGLVASLFLTACSFLIWPFRMALVLALLPPG